MSRLLTLDSTSKTSSVALFQGGVLLEDLVLSPDQKSNSEKLLPAISQLLARHGGHLQQQDELAVTVGPGSFTSLRVGLATIMALAQPLNLPIYPLSSLMVLAWPYLKKEGDRINAQLKAGRGQFYSAHYFLQDRAVHLDGKEVLTPSPPETSIPEGSCPIASHMGPILLTHKLTDWPFPVVSWQQLKLNYIQSPDFGCTSKP